MIFAVVEGRHARLDLGGRHLTVGADEGDFGYLVAEELLDVRKVGDARGDEIALAAAIMFAEQRLADDHRLPWPDLGPHRSAIDRRRLEDRKLAKARQRNLNRARAGRGGNVQTTHFTPQRPQPSHVPPAS